jgi:hypothetical protein
MLINNKEQLKEAIQKDYKSKRDFLRDLKNNSIYPFTSEANAESWLSQKLTGAKGLTKADKMFFSLWFSI